MVGGKRVGDEAFLIMSRSEFLFRSTMDFDSVEATEPEPIDDPHDDCDDEAVDTEYVPIHATYEFRDRTTLEQTSRFPRQNFRNSRSWSSWWVLGSFIGFLPIRPYRTGERDDLDDMRSHQGYDGYSLRVGSFIWSTFFSFLFCSDFLPYNDDVILENRVVRFDDPLKNVNLAGILVVFSGVILYKIVFHLDKRDHSEAVYQYVEGDDDNDDDYYNGIGDDEDDETGLKEAIQLV